MCEQYLQDVADGVQNKDTEVGQMINKSMSLFTN